MLVTRRAGALVLVTQPDHAGLAGELAAVWGNNRFAAPAAQRSLLCAATHHDDGWLELDDVPAYDPGERRPAHFTELPLTRTAGPYGRGVESVYERDPLAGVLVGMHFSGFHTGRWGISGPSSPGSPLAAEIVASQEARWMPVLREVWDYRGPRSRFDADTWHAYAVLQALDLISLAIGLLDLDLDLGPGPAPGTGAASSGPGAPAPAVKIESTLASVDQAPGPRLVTGVPLTAGGDAVDLRLELTAPGRLVVDPYPFGPPRFEVELPARELADRVYEGPQDAAQAFHTAPARRRRCTIAAPGLSQPETVSRRPGKGAGR